MSSAARRKAWNEAMASAGAILPNQSGSRSRKARREKARKSTSYNAASATSEDAEFLVAQHMDTLEGATEVMDVDDDEEYDELEELEDDDEKKSKGKRKKRKRTSSSNTGGNNSVPKYLKARSLASILIEEANRTDSVAKKYVNAAVSKRANSKPRKFCPVTGLPGIYVDPKSGIPYASLTALEQIRERAPMWMNGGGNGGYWEACKALRNDE
ncbi:hypothetical protein ACHAXN_003448 [Cyclotella atomus]